MNTLYVVRLSSGAPRQRTFRDHLTCYASGMTPGEAGRRAIAFVDQTMRSGHAARVESATAICKTPEVLVRPYTF